MTLSTPASVAARVLLAPWLLAIVPTSLDAQRSPAPRRVLSVQPLHAVLGTWAGEFEHALRRPGATVGVAAAVSRWDLRDSYREILCWDACHASQAHAGFATADVRLRSYQGGQALAGEAWGLGLGAVTWRERRADASTGRPGDGRWSGRFRPSITATYDHAQLGDGLPVQMAVGVGIRYVPDAEGTGVVPVWMTLRASIGLAF